MARFPSSKTYPDTQGVIKSESPAVYSDLWGKSVLLEPSRNLEAIKIYLPPKTELIPVPKATSYLGAFGTLISSNTPPVIQDPTAPAPRAVHHDRVTIPKGFNCGLCRPATDGSLVYLLARRRQQGTMPLNSYAFWVFIYDWKARRGFQIRLPQVPPVQNLALLLD
jgi:hypothetical protein